MRAFGLFAIVLLAAGRLSADEKPRAVTFSRGDLDKVPAGWTAAKTGSGEGSVWKVVEDPTAPSKSGFALAQTAESPGPIFNLCVADGPGLKDVEVSVAFKAVKGETDQGGGVVWRYQDANNYYVARYNPLENNYRVYKVVAGKRTQLGSKDRQQLPAGQWHTLSVRMAGDKIECSLNGVKYLEATDGTFAKAGAAGLWTKADAQTHFDDFRVKDLGK